MYLKAKHFFKQGKLSSLNLTFPYYHFFLEYIIWPVSFTVSEFP